MTFRKVGIGIGDHMMGTTVSSLRSRFNTLVEREIMLDRAEKAEPYFVYLRKLMREEFSGSVTVDFFKGGIRSLNKEGEPIIRLKVKETVKLK